MLVAFRNFMLIWNSACAWLDTVVGVYLNTMKTTFLFSNFKDDRCAASYCFQFHVYICIHDVWKITNLNRKSSSFYCFIRRCLYYLQQIIAWSCSRLDWFPIFYTPFWTKFVRKLISDRTEVYKRECSRKMKGGFIDLFYSYLRAQDPNKSTELHFPLRKK